MIASLLFLCRGAFSQAPGQEPEAAAIVEVGGAMGMNLHGGGPSFGPDFAMEFTPIEKWLEIEAGVTPLFARHSTEWGTDVLFKKPWTLSKWAEIMAGIGPEWVHSSQHGMKANSVAGEAVLDFMFWPGAKHKFGWFVEPGYEYDFGRGHERSIGISAGLLIAIPRGSR